VASVTTLVIEAATYVGSVALVDGATLLGERTVAMRGREEEALMPAVAELLAAHGGPGVVRQLVCGAGPGAFTSLRIAGGIAKGLALALGVPLRGVSSLALLVGARPLPPGRYLAALDAMRGESYAQPYSVTQAGEVTAGGPLRVVATTALDASAASLGAVVLGPAQPVERAVGPRAGGAARLTKLIDAIEPADLASWEPVYGRLAEAQVRWEAEHGRPLVAP